MEPEVKLGKEECKGSDQHLSGYVSGSWLQSWRALGVSDGKPQSTQAKAWGSDMNLRELKHSSGSSYVSATNTHEGEESRMRLIPFWPSVVKSGRHPSGYCMLAENH